MKIQPNSAINMQVFSRRIHIEAGQPLGGISDEQLSSDPGDELELNGWAFDDEVSGQCIELCTLDALYAGDLNNADVLPSRKRIFAASHTHYAPMLDGSKHQLGAVSKQGIDAWLAALREVPRMDVQPDRCIIHRADAPVPVYRRFDVPDRPINRLLTRYAGAFPNAEQPIDRTLYLFEFRGNSKTEFVITLHACHPVSRADPLRISPDYVGAVRAAARKRFGPVPCLFLLGCSGDIRPNVARKRIRWLPRNRLNWRFDWQPSPDAEKMVDQSYANAVATAQPWIQIDLTSNQLRFKTRKLPLVHHESIEMSSIVIGDCLRFEFAPFEVSHFFHLDMQKKDSLHFIVTCADRTIGYLPHPTQIAAGGYEVSGSIAYMGLKYPLLIEPGWIW